MNILKLAKHLKEFTLDEINMIAECNCKQELQKLLKTNKLSFNNGIYKFVDIDTIKVVQLCSKPVLKQNNILFKDIAQYYLNNRKLTADTIKGYRALLKYNILPYFGNKYLKEITYEMIVEFMNFLKIRYKPKTASNGVSLLGSIIKFAFDNGYIEQNPYYGIKNSKCK